VGGGDPGHNLWVLVLNERTWNVVMQRLPGQFLILGHMPLAGQEMFIVRRNPPN
jgi:hypothetical protein